MRVGVCGYVLKAKKQRERQDANVEAGTTKLRRDYWKAERRCSDDCKPMSYFPVGKTSLSMCVGKNIQVQNSWNSRLTCINKQEFYLLELSCIIADGSINQKLCLYQPRLFSDRSGTDSQQMEFFNTAKTSWFLNAIARPTSATTKNLPVEGGRWPIRVRLAPRSSYIIEKHCSAVLANLQVTYYVCVFAM